MESVSIVNGQINPCFVSKLKIEPILNFVFIFNTRMYGTLFYFFLNAVKM